MRSVRLVISGKVQDVGYRAFVKRNADMLKIKGHVRNLPTGEVEILCSGPEEAIKEMIKRCKTGPQRASTKKVEIEEKIEEMDNEFEVR